MCSQRTVLTAVFLLSIFFSFVPSASGQVSFSNPVSYPVGTGPSAVAVGDFNGDGKMDLAVVKSGNAAGDEGGVSILLGNGDGTFQAAKNFAAGKNPVSIAAADFNHDDKLDLLVSSLSPQNCNVSVLLGNGDGTFQAPVDVLTAVSESLFPVTCRSEDGGLLPLYLSSVSALDLNHDGNADLIFRYNALGSNVLWVSLGNGDITFQSLQAAGESPGAIGATGFSNAGNFVIGDFNGDRNLDIAIASQRTYLNGDITTCNACLNILVGKGYGTFELLPSANLAASAELTAGDFNGDGKLDLVLVPSGTNSAIIMLGNGDGTFGANSVATGFVGSVVGTADFDGDGKLDLIGSPTSGTSLQLLLGKGDGTFQPPFPLNLTTLNAIGDFNGDQLPDLAVLDSSNGAVNIMLNATSGFALSGSPSNLTVPAGGSATSTINVAAQNGFSEPVSLACSAPASLGIQCSVSPSSVTPGSSTGLTVTTTSSSAAIYPPIDAHHIGLIAMCLPIAGLTAIGASFGSKGKKRKTVLGLMVGCLLFGGVIFQVACGSGSNSNTGGGASSSTLDTPAGDYKITVSGTSDALQRSTTVTITVQ